MAPSIKKLPLDKILFSQGFGTRRHCNNLVFADLVSVNGVLIEDPQELFSPLDLLLTVEGQEWEFHEKAYIVFHKPTGFECSHKTKHHPSIYGLLPAPLVERQVQCVGRLDQDTTGLLLISDDGQFIHKMTSPKKNIGKVYQITTSEIILQDQIDHLLSGVVLDDDPTPCHAIACEKVSDFQLNMTIVEGRYHQVKRMIAAVGNHVAQLHRFQIGEFILPHDLKEGEWRWLKQDELNQLSKNPTN